ncbi:hypothetical protein F5Y17DRAFT_356780 [Xylariaceae sp. FL0594]|nr:hypothetical protein F5Y17DRAFT_356780 [Xylariaceae sp. FL0594]
MISSIASQATRTALLEWTDCMLGLLPTGRELNMKLRKPEQLYDGVVFSKLLEVIDPDYNPDRFEQNLTSQNEEVTRHSMHIIHMALVDFSRRLCGRVDRLEPMIKSINFQALGRHPTGIGMAEVLLVFLCAACFRTPNDFIIEKMQQDLDQTRLSYIYVCLEEVEKKESFTSSSTSEADPDQTSVPIPTTDSTRHDDGLAHEAEVANLQREVDEARRLAGSLKVRLDRLQDNYNELVQKHERLQDENEQLHKQIESETGNFDRHRLQRHLKESEALIANLENERNALIEEKERLLKDRARLETAAHKADSLLDENQLLKAHNEELSKKANMADNLRKKVEASKYLESEVMALRNDRVDLARTFDQLTSANAKIETLKRESEAYAAKMQGYEMDIASMRDQKLVMVAQNQDLLIRIAELEHRSQIDEDVVKELQEKIMMLDPSSSGGDPLAVRPTSLEDELNDSHPTISMRSLEIQRLQAENAVLKTTIGSETDKGQLMLEMEDLRTSRQALQDKYNDLFERFTIGQKQLDLLIENMSGSGEEAYSNLRTQVLAEQGRSKQLERELEAVRNQLGDTQRDLLEARGDLAAVEKSTVDALTELKNTDGMLATALRAELDVERRKYKSLKDESEAMQKQLLTALIDKDELRREAEAASRELQRATDGQTVSADFIKQSEKMEKLRARYKQLQQVSDPMDNSDSWSEDEADVVHVVERPKSFWQTLSPSFLKWQKTPESGYHRYETDLDGSWIIPKRPPRECRSLTLHTPQT